MIRRKNSPNATKLKRKLDASAYPDKSCLWCKIILVRKRQSKSEWDRLSTCGRSCATNFKIHQCSKEEFEEKIKLHVDRYCLVCNTLLVRKKDEHLSSFLNREHCNKACAATGRIRKKVNPAKTMEELSGVKHYTKGSKEFEAIASLYM